MSLKPTAPELWRYSALRSHFLGTEVKEIASASSFHEKRQPIAMIKLRLLFPALLYLAIAGCDFLPTGSLDPDGSSEAKPVIIDSKVELGEYPDDGYQIIEVVGTDTLSDARPDLPIVKVGTLDTDTLALRVQYVGGCKDHEFQLVASDSFMESNPVQAGVQLFHDDNGDTCDALPTETVRFGLTPLEEQYEEIYGSGSGIMLLSFNLEAEERLLVRYEF